MTTPRLRKLLFVNSVILLAIFVGCEKIQLRATGEDDEIVVFADSSEWEQLRIPLSDALERTLLTPQPEKFFNLKHLQIGELEKRMKDRNILILGTIDGVGPVSELIRSSLHTEVQQLIRDGPEYVINKYDLNSRGQIMMFLSAGGIEQLRERISQNAGQLLYFFENAWLKREIGGLYADRKYAQIKIEKHLMKNYLWQVFVQHDYWVATDNDSLNFVWLRRVTPTDLERWLFVHWIDNANPQMLTKTHCFEWRNNATRQFYRTIEDTVFVRISDDPESLQAYQIRETNFLGRYGFEMSGLWQFSDMSGGGPFTSYVFYDEPTRRIYIIDGSVFAPRYEKLDLIMQLRAMAHTFQTISDLTESQREELTK